MPQKFFQNTWQWWQAPRKPLPRKGLRLPRTLPPDKYSIYSVVPTVKISIRHGEIIK